MRIVDPATEFATVAMGDARLDRRLQSCAVALAAGPERSFPEVFPGKADLEGFYRLMANPVTDAEDLLAPHRQQSWARWSACDAAVALVLHDTTELAWAGASPREGLPWDGKKSVMQAHVSLLVGADEAPVVHGVVGFTTFTVADKLWQQTQPGRTFRPLAVGSDRWKDAVLEAHRQAPEGVRLLHVMDREADDYPLWCTILDQGGDFVIRSAQDRRVQGDASALSGVLSQSPFLVSREVWLSRRTGGRPPKTRKTHPDRNHRAARLSVRFGPVEILRPDARGELHRATIELFVVEVVEVEPPDNVEPVRWRLLTTLPVLNPAAALQVVDIYRRRWLIEEFNKALKTGCALEERQAASVWTLCNTTALLLPFAVRLLQLRAATRHEPDTPADGLLDEVELLALKELAPKQRLADSPTRQQVLLAIAAIGGHIRSNGAPGWRVIGRGMRRLLMHAEGWRAALGWMKRGSTRESMEM